MFNFSDEQIERYSRQLILPRVGGKGQTKLLESRVLVVGAGGLGSPSACYLAAAGVGTLGLVDDDRVDLSNLQRQIVHGTADVGIPKTESAARKLQAMNPDVKVIQHQCRLKADNILGIIRDYDVILDGTDNFPTRFLINDACVMAKKPLVHAGIFRFEGQCLTIKPGEGPVPLPVSRTTTCRTGSSREAESGLCSRCTGDDSGNRSNQVNSEYRRTACGKLLTFEALEMTFRKVSIPRDKQCAICEKPTITELKDIEQEECEISF